METTKRNLERVQDILSEIEPRLKSLERQAMRAKEYSRVKADLDVLLRDWYGYHWHQAQKVLSQAKEKQNLHKNRLESHRERQKELDDNLETAQTKIREIREQLNVLHSESAKIHTERENVSRELAVLDERFYALSNQKQDHLFPMFK